MSQPSSRAKTIEQRLRQPTEVRRRLVVEAAGQVIADRGLSRTSMRDIASAAGVSLGTLTYHFTGITEILTEVLAEETTGFYAERAQQVHEAPDAVTGMHLLVDPFFADDPRTVRHWRLWLDFRSLSAHDPELARWQEAVYARWRSDVEAVLVRGRSSGEFLVEDLDTVVVEFTALFDGLTAQAYLPGSTINPAAARRHLRGWVHRRLAAAPAGAAPGAAEPTSTAGREDR